MTKRTETIVPDVSLFEKLGARSRAFPMVITELVDNSLDSWVTLPPGKKKNKKLTIEITASEAKGAWFIVKDNAGGMTMDALINAMKVAKSNKTGDSRFIGTFGFGLKSAAMYVGGIFKVFTVSHIDPHVVNYVEFDKLKFAKQDKWELEFSQMSVHEARKIDVGFKDGHGTIIQIRNDRYRSANKKGIERRLQRTFAPRLEKNPKLKTKFEDFEQDMQISFNDEPIIAAGPFYQPWGNTPARVENFVSDYRAKLKKNPNDEATFELAKKTDYIKGREKSLETSSEAAVIPTKVKWFIEIPGVTKISRTEISDPRKKNSPKAVWGRVGILDRGMGHNNEYGFDLIKNGRVIEQFVLDKDLKNREIGLVASNHNGRIVGQLFLDDWDTDHQKLSFMKDSEQWEELTKYIAKEVRPLLAISSDLQHPGELVRRELNLNADDNNPKAIAEAKFAENIPAIKKEVQKAIRSSSVKEALTSLEKARQTEKPTSGKSKERGQPLPAKTKNTTQAATPSTTSLLFTTPEISYDRKSKSGALVITKVRKERSNDVLEITLNRDHPFLAHRESAELRAIGEFLSIDYYTSYVLKNRDTLTHDDFIELRDSLLRELNPRKAID